MNHPNAVNNYYSIFYAENERNPEFWQERGFITVCLALTASLCYKFDKRTFEVLKYYNLHIGFDPSWETYNEITRLLGVQPQKYEKSKFDKSDIPSDWWYQLEEKDEEPTIDFINVFLDLLEPNFTKLSVMGIERSDILFGLVYVYYAQCAMEFHPLGMERLGRSGIHLNIDCHSRDKEDE